jgi:hypothetical protein
MVKIDKMRSFLIHLKLNGKPITVLIMHAVFIFSQPANADTRIFVFDPNQSTITQTGGLAGVHETYGVEGKFQLTVDFDTGIASFDKVDAKLTELSGFLYTESLGLLFNMTGLAGSIINETTIKFEGKTADGTESDVRLKLSLNNNTARLTGNTTPPPNSADMFFYDVNAVATRKYDGGTGEPNDPYLIRNAGQLNAIGAEPDDWDKHFKLTADVNLQEYTAEQFNIIGTMRDKFVGSFDGAGFTISNFTYSAGNRNYIGLFSQVGDGAQIKDVTLDNVEIEVEKGSSVGALVGFNLRGIISGCCASVSVIGGGGSGNLGALVGFNSRGTVSNCSASGSVTGIDNVSSIGGLVGNNAYGNIYDCTATTTVSGGPGSSDIGGLVGYSEAGTISSSFAVGNVSGDTSLGGLVGYKNDGSIIQCYATGDVSGNTRLGGIVGRNDSGIISDCYATGSIDGDDALGGLMGRNHKGSVSYCYTVGTVNGNSRLGGLVGNDDRGSYISSFWDSDVNPGLAGAGDIDPDPNDIFGKTTAEMQTEGTFIEAGWDFVDETINGPNDIWRILEGQDYPILSWQQVLSDDFEDGEAGSLWFVYEPDMSKIWIEETNGRLEVYTTALADDIDAAYASNGWRLDVTKDFGLKVDFHYGKHDASDSWVMVGLLPSLAQPVSKIITFEAGCMNEQPFYQYEAIDDSWSEEKRSDRSFDDGTLYVSYDAATDKLYLSYTGYGKTNAWRTVTGLLKDKWAAEPVYVAIGGGSDRDVLDAGDAYLDNFVVDSGVLNFTAEPDDGDEEP